MEVEGRYAGLSLRFCEVLDLAQPMRQRRGLPATTLGRLRPADVFEAVLHPSTPIDWTAKGQAGCNTPALTSPVKASLTDSLQLATVMEFGRLSRKLSQRPMACTYRLLGRSSLNKCCEEYGVSQDETLHRALADARAAARLVSILYADDPVVIRSHRIVAAPGFVPRELNLHAALPPVVHVDERTSRFRDCS